MLNGVCVCVFVYAKNRFEMFLFAVVCASFFAVSVIVVVVVAFFSSLAIAVSFIECDSTEHTDLQMVQIHTGMPVDTL